MRTLSKYEVAEVTLLAIHALVSLIFIFVANRQCKNKINPLGWLLSLVVVVVILSLILMQ